ncbi:C1q-like domain-containing protein [Williamsia sterculiae]|nr:hypothetical protein [Williamsia sterculiae]
MLAFDRAMSGNIIQGLNVVANSSPNMTVVVQPGVGLIPTGTSPSNYNYRVGIDTSGGESVTIATAAASPRIDYVVMYVDKGVSGSTSGSYVNNTNNVLKLASVAGTPAGSPNPPTVSQIQSTIGSTNPYVVLAQVAVAASVTSITNPNITDLRVFSAPAMVKAMTRPSYVDSGCLWSATSGLNASMTAGTVYLNVAGTFVPVVLSAVSSQTFTASQDTYVYANLAGTLGYLPVANGGALPTVPANSIWLAKIVTGGSAVTGVADLRLTAPVAANPFKFAVFRNASYAFPSGTATKIPFDSKTFDTGSNFDAITSYRFVAPATGYYQFSGAIEMTVLANTHMFVSIYRNGVEYYRGHEGPSTQGSNSNSTRTVSPPLISLSIGDYVELYGFQNQGSNATTGTGQFATYFGGYLVSTS